jgi:hypothetical protein
LNLDFQGLKDCHDSGVLCFHNHGDQKIKVQTIFHPAKQCISFTVSLFTISFKMARALQRLVRDNSSVIPNLLPISWCE